MRELDKPDKTSGLPLHCLIKLIGYDLCNTLNDHYTNSVLASMLSCETMLSLLAVTHWKLQ